MYVYVYIYMYICIYRERERERERERGRERERDPFSTPSPRAPLFFADEFLAAAGAFAVDWFARSDTRDAASELFRSSSMNVLENEDVRGNARQLVQALLEQPNLQAKTGEHLWAAMKGGILGLGFSKAKPKPLPGAAAAGVAVETEAAAGAAAAGAGAARAQGGAAVDKKDLLNGDLAAPPLDDGPPLAREFALVRRATGSLPKQLIAPAGVAALAAAEAQAATPPPPVVRNAQQAATSG